MCSIDRFKILTPALLSAAGAAMLLTGCDLFGPQQVEPIYGGPAYSGAPAYDNQPIYGQPAYAQQPYGAPAGAPAYGSGDSMPPYAGPPQPAYGAPDQPVSSGSGGASHTVQSGDTLWEISRQYNTTVTAIKQANGLTKDLIQPGQTLIIP